MLTKRSILTWSSAAGIVGPVLFAVVLIVASFIHRATYNPLQQYVSALSAGPFYSLQNLNFIVFGILMVAFAFGLWQGITKEAATNTGSILVGVFGVGLFLMGWFPLDKPWRGIFHFWAFIVAFGSVIPACFIFAKRVWHKDGWQRYSYYSLLTGVAATFFFLMMLVIWPEIDQLIILKVFGGPKDGNIRGPWQLLLISVIWVWIGYTAIKLRRLASGDN